MLIKPPTTPYRLDVKETEKQIEDLIVLKWERRQAKLSRDQSNLIHDLSSFLKDNPKSVIHIYPLEHREKEKEFILLYAAKKKYYLAQTKKNENNFSVKDSITVVNMSIRDSSFANYLNQHCKQSLVFTTQSKCNCLIGNNSIDKEFERLMKLRETNFIQYFAENGTESQVKIHPTQFGIPFNGLSEYTIKYSGPNPESLVSAYLKMKGFNNKIPRLLYTKERKIIGHRP